jgi:hypothetical protein
MSYILPADIHLSSMQRRLFDAVNGKSIGNERLQRVTGTRSEASLQSLVRVVNDSIEPAGLRIITRKGLGYHVRLIDELHQEAKGKRFRADTYLDRHDNGDIWKPRHRGDPLLEALQDNHKDGHGIYPGYRSHNEMMAGLDSSPLVPY